MVDFQITKVTTAPEQKCPECGSTNVVWKELEDLGLGFYECRDCGKKGW